MFIRSIWWKKKNILKFQSFEILKQMAIREIIHFIGTRIGCEPWNPPFIETGIGQLSSIQKRVESSSYWSVIFLEADDNIVNFG